jgi:hypothetical protein
MATNQALAANCSDGGALRTHPSRPVNSRPRHRRTRPRRVRRRLHPCPSREPPRSHGRFALRINPGSFTTTIQDKTGPSAVRVSPSGDKIIHFGLVRADGTVALARNTITRLFPSAPALASTPLGPLSRRVTLYVDTRFPARLLRAGKTMHVLVQIH